MLLAALDAADAAVLAAKTLPLGPYAHTHAAKKPARHTLSLPQLRTQLKPKPKLEAMDAVAADHELGRSPSSPPWAVCSLGRVGASV